MCILGVTTIDIQAAFRAAGIAEFLSSSYICGYLCSHTPRLVTDRAYVPVKHPQNQ